MQLFRPYYYGKHKWDNYLLDLQEAVLAGNTTRQRAVRAQEEALGIAHQKLDAMRQQTDELRELNDVLNSGFEELRSTFEWGFTLIVDRMDAQTRLLSDLREGLSAMHATLNAPLLTQSNELMNRGELRYHRELWDKALRDFLEAEKLDDVNPHLQLKIGQLFIYGVNSSCNVIDLPRGEAHLLTAVRYADASGQNEISGRAYFHAAVAAYLQGEKEYNAQCLDSMRICLERSLTYLAKAFILWPNFIETIYVQAKCHALLGQSAEALKKLEALSDRDRRYFAKAEQDKDFQDLRADVEKVFKQSIESPGPLAEATRIRVEEVAEAVEWAKRSAPKSEQDLARIRSVHGELSEARKILLTLEVDIENLAQKMDRAKADLQNIAQHSLEQNQALANQAMKTCINSWAQRKTSCESAIEQLKQTMRYTTSPGAFWLVAALTVIFEIYLMIAIAPLIMPQVRREESGKFLFAITFFGLPFIAGVIGNMIFTKHKNHPLQVKINELAHSIEECTFERDRQVAPLKRSIEEWDLELRKFEIWRSEHS